MTARFLLLVIASIVLMTVDHRHQHLTDVRAAMGVLVYPLQALASLPRSSGAWLSESISSRRDLQEENASYKAQLLVLQTELQRLEIVQAENTRLRELLDSTVKLGKRILIAEILSVDMEPFSQQIVINRGSLKDVYEGQPLLDAKGIVGQVVSVNPLTSYAMLISDPSHAIPVVDNRSGLRAIALGTGTSNQLELPYIPSNADIKPGDLLVSSGIGGHFPRDYPVATVVSVELNPGKPFARVIAEPTARLDRSREVLLIWPGEQEPQSTSSCPPGSANCPTVTSVAPSTAPATPVTTTKPAPAKPRTEGAR